MAIVNTHYGFCAKGAAAPKFTYTGEYNVRDDGVVELLTSGMIVFLEPRVIDVFMVGGGGSGWPQIASDFNGYGGGGGGYTRTVKRLNVQANAQIPVTIGAGGIYSTASGSGKVSDGGSSGFNILTVSGGGHGNSYNGGAGGSGGGAGVASNSDFGAGGSDGSNGEAGDSATKLGGTGQGFTTREFGEAIGKLYAGGGGGGRYMAAQTPVVSMGGAGGGGSGAWVGSNGTAQQAAAAGVANTGGGGGGGAIYPNHSVNGASGGSGIVCFRDAAPLPELAGTWVLNNRLYAPENSIPMQEINFTAGPKAGSGNENAYRDIGFYNASTGTVLRYVSNYGNDIYNFSSNTWISQQQKIIFPSGATASDEFRAWLASNATKQS